MTSLMGDVVMGKVTPNVANAACNAGRQLLRMVELQYRYGDKGKTLTLATGR